MTRESLTASLESWANLLERSGTGWLRHHRGRVSWSWWRRLALRSLGVPFAIQDTLLDERRWAVICSGHAVSQAGERYRQGDPKHIVSEVCAALCEGRTGDKAPGRRRSWNRAMLAWTADARKVYVIRRVRRGWIVVTALPTDWSETERSIREAAV